ncbi:hypothetical protein [Rhizobium leucaenae]|uniref:hypothetical protein n=1 Tax=Rhizobium leucaenae TaxID=29450 RepID=UPI0007EE86EA|nr:hypothetical protein [Rhizobium leucaenae]
MNAVFDGIEYRINRQPSIYTNRNGREDCRIMRESSIANGGGKYGDKLYRTIAVFAAEDGSVIRDYERLPKEVTMAALSQWGMLSA